MKRQITQEYIKFLNGQSSIEEERALLNSFRCNPETLDQCRQFESDWASRLNPTSEQRLSFAILQKRMRKTHIRRSVIRIAPFFACASVVLALVLFCFWKDVFIHQENTEPICVSTKVGERTLAVLPDDTKVWLNSDTEIRYFDNFLKNRIVELSGEAFFEVTANPSNPFIVKAKNSSIKVLGTKFDVAAYQDENMVQASLLEGKIQFLNETTKIDMVPGEVLTCKSNSVLKCKDDVSQYISWIEGKLVFDSISLDDLLERLSSIYGIQIKNNTVKYAENTFKISLNTDECIDDVLDAISILTPIIWVHTSDSISVKDK